MPSWGWMLYLIGFVAVLTSPLDEPVMAEQHPAVSLIAALVWPLAASGLIILRLWRLAQNASHR
jgi:hypothetical protein